MTLSLPHWAPLCAIVFSLSGTVAAEPAREAVPTHRQYGSWNSSVVSGGGYIQNVVPTSDPKIFYAYVDVAGAWRSADGGITWHSLHGSNLGAIRGTERVRGLVVHPTDPDRLVMATGTFSAASRTGVYVSEDAGRTWTSTLPLWFSETQGRADGFTLIQDSSSPEHLIVATAGEGIHRSEDFGQTWQSLGLPEVYFHGLLADPANPGNFWVNAKPFSDWLEGAKFQWKGGFWYWNGTEFLPLLDEKEAPSEIILDPTTPGRLIGTFDDENGSQNTRVKASTDQGRTWSFLEEGLMIKPVHSAPDDDNRYNALGTGPGFALIGSANATFFRLNKGSDRWSPIPFKVDDQGWWGRKIDGQFYTYFGRATGSLTVDPANPKRWFFTDFYSIWRTEDEGANWVRSTEGIESTVMHNVAQSPSGRAYIGMADVGFFISDDGAQTFRWSPDNNNVATDGISNNVRQIIADWTTDKKRLYAIGSNRGNYHGANTLFVSPDEGENWEQAPMQGLPEGAVFTTFAVDPRDGNVLYFAVAGDPIQAGDPVGEDAEEQAELQEGPGGVYRSTDGGKTVAKFGTKLGSKTPDASLFFDPMVWHHGPELAVGSDGSAVAISFNAGELYYLDVESGEWMNTWPGIQGRMNGIAADPHNPGTYYLVSEGGGLHRSIDSGRSWETVELPFEAATPTRYVFLDQRVAGRIAVPTRDGILYSADNGNTWTQLGRSTPDRWGANPGAFVGDRIVIGTNGSGVFWTKVPDAR